MAHEVETMAYANSVPWHGLGARVDGDVSVEEMLKAAGLDWRLRRVPLKLSVDAMDDSEGMESFDGAIVDDKFAHVRDTDGKIMAVSSGSWTPMQPEETIGFMRSYVAAGAATLETAGSLRGGKVVWGLARLNHNFEVRAGDRVNGYVLITSPNTVGTAITVRTTTVRVVCANTMALANADGMGETHYRQTHMTGFDHKAAKEALGDAHEQLAQAERNAKILDKLKISASDAVTKVLAPVFYPELVEEGSEAVNALMMPESRPRKMTEILTSIVEGAGQKEIGGTGWAVLNGVTYWADHVTGRSNASRLNRAWLGDTGKAKLAVEAKLLELAQ
jgi:phage/plasmid-like protein (TIGR03299 family)